MNRVIFRIAIGCLLFWTLSFMLQSYIGIEFNNKGLEEFYELTRFWGVPICILLTLFGTINTTDKNGDKIFKLILTILTTGVAFFFMVVSVLSSMCTWSNIEVLYTKLDDMDTRIIQREYGCGAWDSGSPLKRIFRVKDVANYFTIVKEIDINTIDENNWIENKTK